MSEYGRRWEVETALMRKLEGEANATLDPVHSVGDLRRRIWELQAIEQQWTAAESRLSQLKDTEP